MTPARLAALREAERMATGAPWFVYRNIDGECTVYATTPDRTPVAFTEGRHEDAGLIQLARNELPALLDALETRTALLRDAREHLDNVWVPQKSRERADAIISSIDAELGGRDVSSQHLFRKPCPVYCGGCPEHGFIHGAEAEELRAGIEEILCGYPERKRDILCALQELLDKVDARDSLAFREWQEEHS